MTTVKATRVAVVVIALGILLVGCATKRPAAAPVPPTAPAQGDPAPTPNPDLSKPKPVVGYLAPSLVGRDVVSGQTVALPSFKGQVVMLNFWATWCPPCKDEMPAMEQLRKSNPEVQILAVGADDNEGAEQLAAFAKSLGLGFPVVNDGGEGALKYKVFGLPTTFIIDRDGTIRSSHTGPLTLAEMKKQVTEAGRPKSP
jgi:cytochrome c biogenesis protein CcmG/thiol:disulfide interchange protein DsbE